MTSPSSQSDSASEVREMRIETGLSGNTFLHDWVEAANRPRTRQHEQAQVSSLIEHARRALGVINRRLHGERAIWH